MASHFWRKASAAVLAAHLCRSDCLCFLHRHCSGVCQTAKCVTKSLSPLAVIISRFALFPQYCAYCWAQFASLPGNHLRLWALSGVCSSWCFSSCRAVFVVLCQLRGASELYISFVRFLLAFFFYSCCCILFLFSSSLCIHLRLVGPIAECVCSLINRQKAQTRVNLKENFLKHSSSVRGFKRELVCRWPL